MNLAKRCNEGRIGFDEFIQFALGKRSMRTHALKEGDYVVMADPVPRGRLLIEQVSKLDYLEVGDFLTSRGTSGPISGNVFIKVDNSLNPPRYELIEGDRLDKGHGSVSHSVNRYLERIKAVKH